MRIMFNRENLVIEEFDYLELISGWEANGNETEEDMDNRIPDALTLSMGERYVGDYNLDGTEATYNNAMDNYRDVALKLLEKGYCVDTDFVNFIWR